MRLAAAATVALVLGVGCTVPTPRPATTPVTPAAASPKPAAGPTRIADLDGDGLADLVSVDPGFTPDNPEQPPAREGGVQVVLSSGSSHRVSMSDLGLAWSDSTAFGVGSLVADLNRDGYADVVVSDPTREPEGDSRGAVYVLWGGPEGISADRFETLAVGAEGSYTGRALALVTDPDPVLAVGIGEGVTRGVALYPVRPDGGLGTPRFVGPARSGIPGEPHRDSAFGSVLVAGGDQLVVGDPGARVAGAARAGAVTVLRPGVDGFAPLQFSEATAGVPGAPEAGDAFGSSLSLRDGLLAVGAPGEDVGSYGDAGRVYLFSLTDGGPSFQSSLTQEGAGAPGRPGQAHRFGEALLIFRPCEPGQGLLVSAPGETVDLQGHQGAVHVVPLRDGCAAASLTLPVTGIQPLGFAGSLTALRSVRTDQVESIAVVVDGGVAVLDPPFSRVTARHALDGRLVAPAG